MKVILVVIVTVLVLVLGLVGFAYSGWYDVSASSQHSGVVSWLLSTTSRASVERRASEIQAPDLGSREMQLAGASDFDAMCAGCHGAPGRERDPIGQGLNPTPPDLSEHAGDMTPAELFWVTKHGIRMTGMPGWGATHSDDEMWPVVAFMTELPRIDAARYDAMLERAEAQGNGHHGDASHDHTTGQADGTGANGAAEPSNEPPTDEDHDHHDHAH